MSRARHAKELTTVLLIYAVVALGVSWPLARDPATHAIGDVAYDQRHTIWILWHVKEALLGRQPWFTADLLFYPHGVSTLIDGVGPLNGIFALPFWPWGPVAAYNGAALVGLTMSGWCMYVLARHGGRRRVDGAADSADSDTATIADTADAANSAHTADSSDTADPWGFDTLRPFPAFFAGLLFMVWPIHLAGLYGHLEKLFLGLLPLNVLAGLLAYDPARSRRWLIAPGVALLLILLQNGNQFTFAIAALVLLAALGLWRHWRRGDACRPFVRRVLISGAIAIVITAPLLIRILSVMRDPNLTVTLGNRAAHYSPDLLQLVVPSLHQAVGRAFYPDYDVLFADHARASLIPSLSPRYNWYGSGIETAVTIPITVLLLASFAWRRRRRESRPWLLFGVVFTGLALGPFLRILGTPLLPMPYLLLALLPGFDVMRTPGRFMMIASVGLSLVAAFGLAALLARWPRRARVVGVMAIGLVLAECWPRPWPQQSPPPIPEFYRRLAQDSEHYAVLDLPSGRWSPSAASAYQFYQLTHHKPIAWGYLSRQYVTFPIAGLDGILDDTAPHAISTRARLVQLGYRYVVWHKRAADLFGDHRPERIRDRRRGAPPDTPLHSSSHPFLRKAFAGETPIADDDLVTVFRLDARAAPGGSGSVAGM